MESLFLNRKYSIFVFVFICLSNCLFGQIRSKFEENSNKFALEGFGFKHDLEEYKSITIFIQNHGNPIKTTVGSFINLDTGWEHRDITLEYNNFIISFVEWNDNFNENGHEFEFSSIKSKDDVEYLYGIKHGMTKEELATIIEFSEIVELGLICVYAYTGETALIFMKDNKIQYIKWDI
jgi:hypothetical protein